MNEKLIRQYTNKLDSCVADQKSLIIMPKKLHSLAVNGELDSCVADLTPTSLQTWDPCHWQRQWRPRSLHRFVRWPASRRDQSSHSSATTSLQALRHTTAGAGQIKHGWLPKYKRCYLKHETNIASGLKGSCAYWVVRFRQNHVQRGITRA